MGATGTAVINFGAFPGSDQASVAVTGQTGIQGGPIIYSRVEAWLDPTQGGGASPTADHSVGEHVVAETLLDVRCEALFGGTGFTITATIRAGNGFEYGQWAVAWAWF